MENRSPTKKKNAQTLADVSLQLTPVANATSKTNHNELERGRSMHLFDFRGGAKESQKTFFRDAGQASSGKGYSQQEFHKARKRERQMEIGGKGK